MAIEAITAGLMPHFSTAKKLPTTTATCRPPEAVEVVMSRGKPGQQTDRDLIMAAIKMASAQQA